jgi:hypothetical protein
MQNNSENKEVPHLSAKQAYIPKFVIKASAVKLP